MELTELNSFQQTAQERKIQKVFAIIIT